MMSQVGTTSYISFHPIMRNIFEGGRLFKGNIIFDLSVASCELVLFTYCEVIL